MRFKILRFLNASGAKFRASSKSAPGNFVPLQNFQITTPLSRIFGGADGGAKSAPCNPTRIALYKFLYRAPKPIAYIATRSLAKWRSSLSRIAQRSLTRCIAQVHNCSAKWRKILCRAVGVLRAKKARYPLPTVRVYSLTRALEFPSNSLLKITSQKKSRMRNSALSLRLKISYGSHRAKSNHCAT